MLLCHVCGPTSYEYLRTVDGVTYSTLREAALNQGLLLNDQHYHKSLTEAAQWKTGHQLRHMLAIILCHSSPGDPTRLWLDHIEDLSDDCARTIRRLDCNIVPSHAQVINYALSLLQKILIDMECDLADVGLPEFDQHMLLELNLPSELEERNRMSPVDQEISVQKFNTMANMLTNEQLIVLNQVRNATESKVPYLSYVDGPGGTGKTFLLNTLLHFCNSTKVPFIAVSASGIAALLLLNG